MSGTQGYDHCAKCVLFANERDEARAEVERLKGENQCLATSKCHQCVAWNRVGQLEDEVERLRKDKADLLCRIESLWHERNKAFSGQYCHARREVCAQWKERAKSAEVEVERLRMALGLLTTIKGSMEVRPNDTMGMAQEIVAEVARLKVDLSAAHKHLRDANRGAETNAKALRYSCERNATERAEFKSEVERLQKRVAELEWQANTRLDEMDHVES